LKLFTDLEPAGIDYPSVLFFELENIDAPDEIGDIHGGFGIDIGDVFYSLPKEVEYLQLVCLAGFFFYFKSDIRNGWIGVEFGDFRPRIGQKTTFLAFCPGGCQ
jgi:hypothetical protein